MKTSLPIFPIHNIFSIKFFCEQDFLLSRKYFHPCVVVVAVVIVAVVVAVVVVVVVVVIVVAVVVLVVVVVVVVVFVVNDVDYRL